MSSPAQSGSIPPEAAQWTAPAPPPAPRLDEPGLRRLPPGTERYVVRGGGATVVPLRAGDTLEIIDPEGRQPGEVVAFDGTGRADAGLLGLRPGGAARALAALLAGRSEDARRIAASLRRRGLRAAGAEAARVFDSECAAGERRTLTAQGDGVLCLSAPGGPMRVDGQDPPTDLLLYVHRRGGGERGAAPPLPEPLARLRLDLHVAAGTARAYEVKAGEFIQIIDVEGRECSDFQAFRVAELERGVERCIDPSVTRTLAGAAYPGPGLLSKYWDDAMQPLVEVVRDTVGRHDTFGVACSAKYYEDLGYPGHVNCSDNFSRALAPYGVAARRGWMAANFFYNTSFDDRNQLYLDEPWSRPGDYVLLRALADLVCVSSACPDDIDAANAWNPTDIRVRVYPGKNPFSKALAHRMTPDAEPVLTRETGFHPRTSALTRSFTEYRGFWLPSHFPDHGVIREYWACRERAVMLDLSALRKFEVLGPDAEALLQATFTRNVRRLAVGQVAYGALCYESGGMIDDATLFRLGADNFRLVGGDDYCGVWLREQAGRLGLRAWVKSSTDQLHNLSVQGPASREILSRVVWTPPAQPGVAELAWFRFAIGRIGAFDGVPLIVSRTGYTGELGYEVWCHPSDAPALWDALWEAGEPRGLAPMGLDALDLLRIEAGLVFGGQEFDDRIDPFEAGIGFAVALKSRNEDFVGRAALERRKAAPQRRLAGLVLAGEEVAAHGDGVYRGRARVGEVTSGARSPALGRSIALARLVVEYAAPGTEVEVGRIDGHQKRLPARVAPLPFYDPEKTRVRS